MIKGVDIMYNQVTKRDGKVVEFDISKIADAIKKAFAATDTEYNDSVIDFLALKVTAEFQNKISNGKIAVEDIQDSVESVLSRGGYENVAKAYILYRKTGKSSEMQAPHILTIKRQLRNT